MLIGSQENFMLYADATRYSSIVVAVFENVFISKSFSTISAISRFILLISHSKFNLLSRRHFSTGG